jgi:transcriptional regulator with XRE-family HTH domain
VSLKKKSDRYLLTIGPCLAKLRLQRNLSAYALAQSSGVSPQTIGYYERGERRPSLDCLVKLAYAMELEPSALLSVVEEALRQDSPSS